MTRAGWAYVGFLLGLFAGEAICRHELGTWRDVAIRCGAALDKCGARAYPDWYIR